MKIYEEIEEQLSAFLQSNIIFYINDRKYKQGKFINFKIDEMHIEIHYIYDKKMKKLDFPIPFLIINNDSEILMSYKMSDIGPYGNILDRKIKEIFDKPKNKLYNSILKLKRG